LRDRDLLSDKEFFRKTTDIVEQVRDCEINVTYYRGSNSVSDVNINNKERKGVMFNLNVATPTIKGIEKFTALNHELGHILMQTPMYEATKLLKGWLKVGDDWIDGDGRGLQKWNVFWGVMNVLEDQRVESMMSKIWLANQKRFNKAKKNLGKTHKTCLKNPVDILLNIRFFREDLTKKHKESKEYKRALEDVVETGRMGSLIILARLKPLIDEYFEKKKKIETKGSDDDITKSLENVHKPEAGDGSDQRLSSDDLEACSTEDIDIIDRILDGDDNISGLLNDSKQSAKNDISEIKEIMSGDGTDGGSRLPSYVMRVNREGAEYHINKNISGALQKIFRKISEIPKPTIGYDGDDIDIETYIENKARGSDLTKCFIDKKYVNGASVMISIDGSGSMDNGRIEDARNLVATLYDSVKDYPNITIKANVWSSNAKGDVGITDINTIKECVNIVTRNSGSCFMTPTHLALDYSSRMLKIMKGRKKILFLITDGLPQYSNNNYALKKKTLLTMNKKAMLKARRKTPNIFVFFLGNSTYGDWYVKEAFGARRVINVPSMRGVSDNIIKEFKKLVINTLK
tara:strand:+ start:1305 stop:3026 length:1722 start_codon:yes stop_codon:yes gene_type:complete